MGAPGFGAPGLGAAAGFGAPGFGAEEAAGLASAAGASVGSAAFGVDGLAAGLAPGFGADFAAGAASSAGADFAEAAGFAAPGLAADFAAGLGAGFAPGFGAPGFAAGLAAFFAPADFSPPAGAESAKASFTRRTTGASSVEEAERTNSPMSWSFSRTFLLVVPSSFASSWTRGFATVLLSGFFPGQERTSSMKSSSHFTALSNSVWVSSCDTHNLSSIRLPVLFGFGVRPREVRGGDLRSKGSSEGGSGQGLVQALLVRVHPRTTPRQCR